ncbi:MAG TPA: SAM-dependent chlorinase/fluorinase [Solirubrobacteraceae bacterium]|nr:SAM-dependent chlorinase/fluorinase [Solirubrobacteraceae bacterium]
MTLITFLSDYGLQDEFVGVCHGVLARLAPDARVIDISHGIPRHDVRTGALTLASALPYFPAGVHLAVVDPDVGQRSRRAVALRVGERILVGPDNGLLMPAAAGMGEVVEAIDVTRSEHRLDQMSATFHGRDVFAPVAAALARGEPLLQVGEPMDVGELVELELPVADVDGQGVLAHVLDVDRFGNATLDARHEQLLAGGLRLGGPVQVQVGPALHIARFAVSFADVPAGTLLLYEDARSRSALAVNRGSAADALGLARDDAVRLRPE